MSTLQRARDALRAWQKAGPCDVQRDEHANLFATGDDGKAHGKAHCEKAGGLTVLHLSGSPWEMGYQQGVLARDLIHGYRQAAYDYVASVVPLPRRLVRPALFYQAAAYWPTIPAELTQEMQGIADGAGVHPIEVLVSAAIWEMLLVSGCSEFAAVGPATAGGELIHGYNYDLMHPDHALIQPYLSLLFFHPDQGIPFFTVNTVGSVGANAGMNAAGISVAWDNTRLKDGSLVQGLSGPMAPFTITLRRLLQYAWDLQSAERIMAAGLPRTLGDIVIISSAREGRAVALETAGRSIGVRPMNDDAIWSTNCFRSPLLAPHDHRGDGRFLDREEAWQHFPRYSAYTELFEANRGRIDPGVAASFLRDPYPREALGYRHRNPAARATICRSITSFSLVMQPGLGRCWVSDTELPSSQGRFFAFDLWTGEPLPRLDLPCTGYQSAVRAAQSLETGDWAGALNSVDEASRRDGPSAPLLLARAALLGLVGDEEGAGVAAENVRARWPGTPAAALAAAWLAGDAEPPPEGIPFPSAIRPMYHLRPAATWAERIAASPGGGACP